MTSSPDAALKLEIARLSGVINRHKTAQQSSHSRSNTYVNPNYKPPSNSRPSINAQANSFQPSSSSSSASSVPVPPSNSAARDVVIGGITFQSSGRSLVRKDLAKPNSSTSEKPFRHTQHRTDYSRTTTGHMIPNGRPYKSHITSRGRRGRPGRPTARNMTLDNTGKAYPNRRPAKQRKYIDKPCPRFTTTGACSRGLTCPYQHDPNKVAICWPFLQGNCPNSAETCHLSHDPIPERTPLCVHFANNGRCTRQSCPFPHVRVGQRKGVCRDFAVLGYCAKGLDCEMQHVRECPDFAEKGTCSTKGCKLPHVIRANRNRKAPEPAMATQESSVTFNPAHVSAENAQLGDEFISLTFNESEEDSDDVEEEDEDGSGVDDDVDTDDHDHRDDLELEH
ncbi:hypothetical protein CONPUDRAFT_138447 [Coniophora puteana RWD-64-598 SS2]|uniref:C3H1-type domain-containing protein n=1 Tax=Coniophora puteana (strain RWD-64-598) TaxID=741705 RepID=A0A5M3MK45_CONPW|nr:uncharacterized protein CONPUDRAFT_138447 [Coniophora puteana RWD-64-598 SS2]EIW79310.1 hypothetical protein CONPUDRAFT_138447 [Coniophora puteana RWD-64-598 SS2]